MVLVRDEVTKGAIPYEDFGPPTAPTAERACEMFNQPSKTECLDRVCAIIVNVDGEVEEEVTTQCCTTTGDVNCVWDGQECNCSIMGQTETKCDPCSY